MEIKCETHTRNDAIVLCHHCGRPLCNLIKLPYKPIQGKPLTRDHLCGYSIRDSAFSHSAGQNEIEASHCENCLQVYHTDYSSHVGRLKASL